MSFLRATMVCVFMAIVCASIAIAQVPLRIGYQGVLADAVGDPIDCAVDITFRIYDADSDGTRIWAETQSVIVADGVFHVDLGAVIDLDLADFPSGEDRWLSVQVDTDIEMIPRQRLISVPYALRASDADTVGGQIPISNLDGVISDGAIDLIAGVGIAITPNDGTNTITIKATGSAGDTRCDATGLCQSIYIDDAVNANNVLGTAGTIGAANPLFWGDSLVSLGPHFTAADAVTAINADATHGATASHNYFTAANAVTAINADATHGATASHNYTTSLAWGVITGKPNVISSLDGVDNNGTDIDLVGGVNITITPDNVAKTITIAAQLDYWQEQDTNWISRNNTTYALVEDGGAKKMLYTATSSGVYLVMFSATMEVNGADDSCRCALYVDLTREAHTVREFQFEEAWHLGPIAFQSIVVVASAPSTFEVRWRRGATNTTCYMYERTMSVIRLQ